MKNLKLFENHTEYEQYKNSGMILPNVSRCIQDVHVHYNPYVEPQYRTTSGEPYCNGYDKYVDVYSQESLDGGISWNTISTTPTLIEHNSEYCGFVETRVVAKYNVTSTSSPTRIASERTNFSSFEIDGVQLSVRTGYTFTTTGEHTVKYTLKDSTKIDNNAFSGCTSLTSIVIPDSVTRIGNYAFAQCSSLTSIGIPNGVTSIGDRVFTMCTSLRSIVIPDGVTSIGDSAFYRCGLRSCTIGSGVTSIGNDAFDSCTGLTSIVIPDSVTSIGISAFYSCQSLTSCTIGNGVTSIGDEAFLYCYSLTNIDIPDSVTSIGNSAFKGCRGLISCTIGSGVTSIGGYAFSDLTGFTSITSNATTAATIASDTFKNVKTNGTLTVPSGSSGYDTWMQNANYYLGLYNWTKVEQ